MDCEHVKMTVLSSIEMCIHLIWYYKDVNKSAFAEVTSDRHQTC